MNANELADKSFMGLWDAYTSKKMKCEDLEEKLRQQQAEKEHIAGLNTLLKMQVNVLKAEIEVLKAKLAQADRVYDFDNPLLNSDDVGFKQIELNAELLRKANEK